MFTVGDLTTSVGAGIDVVEAATISASAIGEAVVVVVVVVVEVVVVVVEVVEVFDFTHWPIY